jgi:DNA-binding MarR family transcriptional regulator
MPRPRSEPTSIESPAGAAPDAWARYRDNLARHLIGLARDLQIRLMNHLVGQRGHRDLRPSFGLPITLIARAPRPLSELARTLAISPQAASQLVGLAERAGYVARRNAPQDRRARVAVLTTAGERLVEDAVACLRALETEQAEQVGPIEHGRFVAALAALAETLASDAGQPSGLASGRASIGALPLVAARIEQRLMHATSEHGHVGLKLSHGQILTLIGPSGARLHQLALLHRVSRQAISATAQDLEALGYLRREPDPHDRRGVVVRLTPRGTRLIEDSVSALDALDRGFRATLGPDAFAVLERVARALYGGLELETGLLSAAFPEPSTGASLATDRTSSRGGLPETPRASSAADLARLAARLRDRLGSRDAARLAVHLAATP